MCTMVRSLLCVVLLVSLAWADSSSPKISDAEYKQYIEASPEFKTAERDINGIYKELMSVLNETEKNALKDEQRQWIKQRDITAFSEGQKGSQGYVAALVKLTAQRKTELETRLQSVTQKPAPAPEMPLTPQQTENQNLQHQAETPVQPSQQPSSDSNNQTTKFIIISLLLISVVSVFLHFSGKLVLYKDYTDAAITIGGVLGSLLILFICRNFLDLSIAASRGISLLFFFAIFIFVFRMTYVTNNNFIFTILSVLTKYTTTFLYTILMLGLMFSGSSRRKGESSLAFELRRQREEAQNKAWMAIITALFLWFVHATTKLKEWSPVGNYFSLSFKKLDLNELATAGNESLVSEKEI